MSEKSYGADSFDDQLAWSKCRLSDSESVDDESDCGEDAPMLAEQPRHTSGTVAKVKGVSKSKSRLSCDQCGTSKDYKSLKHIRIADAEDLGISYDVVGQRQKLHFCTQCYGTVVVGQEFHINGSVEEAWHSYLTHQNNRELGKFMDLPRPWVTLGRVPAPTKYLTLEVDKYCHLMRTDDACSQAVADSHRFIDNENSLLFVACGAAKLKKAPLVQAFRPFFCDVGREWQREDILKMDAVVQELRLGDAYRGWGGIAEELYQLNVIRKTLAQTWCADMLLHGHTDSADCSMTGVSDIYAIIADTTVADIAEKKLKPGDVDRIVAAEPLNKGTVASRIAGIPKDGDRIVAFLEGFPHWNTWTAYQAALFFKELYPSLELTVFPGDGIKDACRSLFPDAPSYSPKALRQMVALTYERTLEWFRSSQWQVGGRLLRRGWNLHDCEFCLCEFRKFYCADVRRQYLKGRERSVIAALFV